jgi:hypothetical protein
VECVFVRRVGGYRIGCDMRVMSMNKQNETKFVKSEKARVVGRKEGKRGRP